MGYFSELYGDCSNISGNCTDISGNLDDCELTDKERATGVDIKDLIK